MPDYLAVARNGVKLTEDGGASQAIFEEGPLTVVAVTAPLVLTTADHGKLCTNEGGVGAASTRAITLPACYAGACQRFYDQSGLGIRPVAGAGDTIRIGNSVSKAAGYVESSGIGQFLTLRGINATEWVAEQETSLWTVEES